MKGRIRYARGISQTVLLLLLYITEDCLLPEIFGVVPCLLLPFTVAVGLTEGVYFGAFFGVAAGILTDFGGSAVGFSSMLLLVIGACAGLATVYFRLSKITAFVYTLLASVFFFFIKWFFIYFIFYGYGRIDLPLLQTVYAGAFAVPVYILVHFLSKRFGSLKGG